MWFVILFLAHRTWQDVTGKVGLASLFYLHRGDSSTPSERKDDWEKPAGYYDTHRRRRRRLLFVPHRHPAMLRRHASNAAAVQLPAGMHLSVFNSSTSIFWWFSIWILFVCVSKCRRPKIIRAGLIPLWKAPPSISLCTGETTESKWRLKCCFECQVLPNYLKKKNARALTRKIEKNLCRCCRLNANIPPSISHLKKGRLNFLI